MTQVTLQSFNTFPYRVFSHHLIVTDDVISFPISKFAQYFNATWQTWPVSVPYISRHPCLWITEHIPSSDELLPALSVTRDSALKGEREREGEREEWERGWKELGKSERLRDYARLPAHTMEELESQFSAHQASQKLKRADVVTANEVSQIRKLIWQGGVLPSMRGQIWIHLSDTWEFLTVIGQSEFDLRHEFLDHIHKVTPTLTEGDEVSSS